MKQRLFLFDIDQTLILGGGSGRRALERAFMEMFRHPDALSRIATHGKTDTSILDEMVSLFGLTLSPQDEAKVWERYLFYLTEELVATIEAKVNPGIPAILDALKENGDAFLGLLTGNIYRGAKTKLEHFDLWRYFPTGGFGDDDRSRNKVAHFALKRCSDHFNVPFEPDDVYVIGDSLRDIECAEAIRARSIIVATGNDPYETLKARNPHAIFHDFSETGPVLDILQGNGRAGSNHS